MMKFIAADVEAAKAKARRALGDGVAIVSVRNLPSGDVEVSASDQPDAQPPSPVGPGFGAAAKSAMDNPFQSGGPVQASSVRASSGGSRLNEPLEQKFAEDALQRLTQNLAGRKAKKRGPDLSDKTAAGIADLLAPHGVDDALLEAMIAGARKARIEDDLYQLETAFGEVFSFSPAQPSPAAPLMLVGPTGAGKTSCGAKLAAAAMQSGMGAFIMTADVGRAGAIEQIKTYGDTLGADYYIVETPLDVQQVLRSTKPTGAVILDTPGISPFDAGDVAALRSFREASGAEPVFVLPASGDAAEYKDWATAFAEFGVRRMIVTKFDATKRVGAALTAAFAGRMALSHFSETPFISEGLLDASPSFLARRMLAARPGRIAG